MVQKEEMIMWTRKELKDRAKAVLKTTYWKAFLASLILTMVGGGGSFFTFEMDGGDLGEKLLQEGRTEVLAGFILLAVGAALTAAVVGILISVFVGGPLEVGVQKFFLGNQEERGNLNDLGGGFAKESYLKVVTAMFLRSLYIFLWSLLFLIPGIVMGYAYQMVPYILAENPGMESKEALARSRAMTEGHKWNMFVLDLSFLGWMLLGLVTFGIGILFVMPYVLSTRAELYLRLKQINPA